MRHRHMRVPDDVPLKKVETLSKGKINRRIIGRVVHDGREYLLHATKSYRSTRA